MPPAALRKTASLAPLAAAPSLAEARNVLEEVFGYTSFRPHQAEIIEALIGGGDVLALMPTGGGKSLCYQIPSLVRRGTGIVVSPLIALMQDQVDALKEAGVRAAFLNSSQDRNTQDAIERQLVAGSLDLLYVAPERLVQDRTLRLLERAEIALFAIDEAHCVSQWGHDFRPEYRQLKVLASRFPSTPRIALTATADQRTREEIATELCLENALRRVASFDRPNIRYTIAEMGSMSARERLWSFLAAEHPSDAGVVYCLSRKSVDETAAWLVRKGRNALAYHAGLDPEVRRAAQERFLKEDNIIMVATVAFGMGIDKPDVRFVIHANIPKNIEAYYQETGRAGRDGLPSNALMLYGMRDVALQRSFIDQGDAPEQQKRIESAKLNALLGLCEAASCRRQILLAYFGDMAQPCGHCDNCDAPPDTFDGTIAAQKAISAVLRTGQRFGVHYVVQHMLGKGDERSARAGHDALSTFGIGEEYGKNEWLGIFRQLIARDLLHADAAEHNVVKLTEAGRQFLKEKPALPLRHIARKAARGRERSRAQAIGITHDDTLFTALKAARMKLAKQQNVPPYVIFHDKTLMEMAAIKPQELSDFALISGVGEKKMERYGPLFLQVIHDYAQAA